MADWRTDVIRAVGGKPTQNTLAFLQGWGTKEGGHLHNTARFNWLNRIDTQYPSAGVSVKGIAAYPNYQTGVQRTAQLLQQGYPAIYGALRGGQVSLGDPNVQGDLNRWLSGKRTPGMTPYVASVGKLSGLGGGGPQGAVGAPPQAPPPTTAAQRPQLSSLVPLLAAISSRRQARQEGTRAPIGDLVGAILGMRQQRPQNAVQEARMADPAAPGPVQPKGTSNGFLQAPTQWAGTHVTDNLGWGTKSAEDIMARPGTAVGAPEDGVVVRLGSAQGGESMYFRGTSGKTYWLGHVANSLPPGSRVRRGQVITHISPDHPRPHLHIDRR